MPHSDATELQQALVAAAELVTIGGRYFHYKNPTQFYIVIDLALIEATCEPAVIYEALYAPGLKFIRPLSDFLARVTHLNGEEGSRFTFF